MGTFTGGGDVTPRVAELTRTNSQAVLIRKLFPNVGCKGHRNGNNEHLCVGPGTVPLSRVTGLSSQEHQWEFYDSSKHPEPTLKRSEFGARLVSWKKENPQPVSNTTGHFMSLDNKIAALDVYQLVIKTASELDVEVTALYYTRYTGDHRKDHCGDKDRKYRYEPTGHMYFSIAPGNNAKLLIMIQAMDKLTFPLTHLTTYNPVTGTMESVSTSVTGCQLSTSELIAFHPADQQFKDRDPLAGPKYFSECCDINMHSELDAYGWYGFRGVAEPRTILPGAETVSDQMGWDYDDRRLELQELFPTRYEFGMARPATRLGCTYRDLGGRSYRSLLFGPPDRVVDGELEEHMRMRVAFYMNNVNLLTVVGFQATRMTTQGADMKGPYTVVNDQTLLKRLMSELFGVMYELTPGVTYGVQ